jgi:uncharacterized protein YaeQ
MGEGNAREVSKGVSQMEKTIVKTNCVATWDNVGRSANAKKIADALKAVGLNFEVEKRPIFFGPDMKKIADKFATVRTDKDGYLGIVGKGYEICQNETAFAFADYIDEKLKFTRGGMTYSGLCWVVGQLPSIKILGEEYTPCIVLQNSFNGKYKVRANIVALNTANYAQFNMSLAGIASTLTVKHSSSLPYRMKQGQETLTGVREYMDGLRKAAERYAGIKMDKTQIEMFIEVMFPIKENMNETAKANVIKQRKAFLDCYDDAGNKAHWGNAWGLIRAYADFVTHTIGKDTKTKFERKFMKTTLSNKKFGGFLKKLEGVTGVKVA